MKKIIKHLSYSLSLFGILMAGFVGLVLFSYDIDAQILIAGITSGAYVVWGVVHHIHNKDFHWEIFIEYLAVAVLGFIFIFTLIIGS